MSQRRPGHAPVAFDELLWQKDLKRESGPGSDVARRHRAEIELEGQPMADLAPVEQTGAIALPRCAKVYLPDSAAGRWSMIFQAGRDAQTDRFYFDYIAFGLRHPPGDSPRWSVYELAYTASTGVRRDGRRAEPAGRPQHARRPATDFAGERFRDRGSGGSSCAPRDARGRGCAGRGCPN